jgi:hypothetical protein
MTYTEPVVTPDGTSNENGNVDTVVIYSQPVPPLKHV